MLSPAPSLSVIVNNYNYAPYLRACIESVLSQLAPEDEFIVVDDGSKDASLDILAEYEGRIRLVAQANAGQAAAMNSGVAAARGDVFLLLDADDMFLPGKLEAVRSVFRRITPDRPACLTHRFRWIDRHGAPRISARNRLTRLLRGLQPSLRKVSSAWRAQRYTSRYGYLPWPCHTRTSMLCINRAMAERVFPLPAQDARICADEFVVRGALYSGDFYYLDRTLTAYRDHGTNGWLHRSAAPQHRAYLAPLREYLAQRHHAAGGGGRLDAEDAVLTSIYVREGLTLGERWRAAWRRSPRDLEAAFHIALLMARRSPQLLRSWLRCRSSSRQSFPL